MEAVIGLEIHVELSTDTKLFCGCSTAFGAAPNTQVCPICLGLPGHKPHLNQKAVEFHARAALALNCEVRPYAQFDRKNYFYADLPKGYQTTQFFHPMAVNGYVDVNVDGETRLFRIRQIHLEEDTGKLLHAGDSITEAATSLVDFNRAGVPLLEIVTHPDVRSAEEARLFLQKLHSIIRYTEVSDCKMQEGSLRCDANVSVRPRGSEGFGEKTELKNMNSFRAVAHGIEYEIKRQIAAVRNGEEVRPETRHWDEAAGVTKAMRTKGEATDYRFFPDPNVPPLEPDRKWVDKIKKSLPELPDSRYARLVKRHGLPPYDAGVITASRAMADFYDEVVALFNEPKTVSNWLMGEVSRCLNAAGKELEETTLTPQQLAELLGLIKKGVISGKIAKDVFDEVFETGRDPETIVKEKGLVQIADEDELAGIIDKVTAANPKVVEDFRGGKDRALGFLVGQVMKETRGKANPKLVSEMLREKLQS